MSSIAITINGQRVTLGPDRPFSRRPRRPESTSDPLPPSSAGAQRRLPGVPRGSLRPAPLQPACTFPVTDRMEIQTESPKVVRARKFVLELLFPSATISAWPAR